MKNIGILGGTFNPIHVGHLAIAEAALKECRLDRVIFVPSNRPPHRNITQLASPQDRYNMVALSIKHDPRLEVSDFEIKKEGKSYTIDTVRYFREILPPGTKMLFIIGADNFSELQTWKDIDEILKIVSFVVVSRPGFEVFGATAPHHVVSMPGVDVSASQIRRCLAQGKSIKNLVPESAFRYIKRHKLYQS